MEINSELNNSILKSGTTLVGIVCKDGVVMAADKRSTAGNIVMDKDSEKIRMINDFLAFAGTGMVSDIQRSIKIAAAELRIKELHAKSRPTVRNGASLIAAMIYGSIRQPTMLQFMVGSLVGGVNEDGSTELYTIDPSGGIKKVKDYDANFGSGMPYVLGLLERQYKPGMTVKEGVELAVEALKSSTQRDTGSGNGVDVYTITKSGISKVVDQDILPRYVEETKQ